MPNEDWRSAETIESLTRLERPGFAIEFMRRNPEYRRDFTNTERQISRRIVEADAARHSLARRWGLRFRP